MRPSAAVSPHPFILSSLPLFSSSFLLAVSLRVSLQHPPPPDTAAAFSISLLSAGQRHIDAPLSLKKTLSRPALSLPFSVSPSPPPLIFLIGRQVPLLWLQFLHPHVWLSLSLSLSLRGLPRMCDVQVVYQRNATLLQYLEATRLKALSYT